MPKFEAVLRRTIEEVQVVTISAVDEDEANTKILSICSALDAAEAPKEVRPDSWELDSENFQVDEMTEI